MLYLFLFWLNASPLTVTALLFFADNWFRIALVPISSLTSFAVYIFRWSFLISIVAPIVQMISCSIYLQIRQFKILFSRLKNLSTYAFKLIRDSTGVSFFLQGRVGFGFGLSQIIEVNLLASFWIV